MDSDIVKEVADLIKCSNKVEGMHDFTPYNEYLNQASALIDRILNSAKDDEFKKGDEVYMPDLGDTPDRYMIYLTCYGESEYGKMAVMKRPNRIGLTEYPYRYIKHRPKL